MRLGAKRVILLGGKKSFPIGTPTINLDLTSALPSQITFTRSGTRNAISNGALVSVATGTPAFESWDGVNHGMAIEASSSLGGISQIVPHSNDTSTSWSFSNFTRGTGDAGPDGVAGSLSTATETTASAIHQLYQPTVSIAAGVRSTVYTIVKRLATSTRWAVKIRISNQYNNGGPQLFARIDGVPGFFIYPDDTVATNPTGGIKKLANGMYLIWITATWVSSGNKDLTVGGVDQLNASSTIAAAYQGIVTEGFQIFGIQCIAGEKPAGWVTTTTAAVSQPAETAVFNDTSWFSSTAGTFVIEHDCTTGVLIGSGSNAIFSATVPGKTAFAWDATGSDLVNNAGSTTAGTTPTFGADVRLLGTNAVGNIGHIKSIKFYNVRKSVLEMQTLTAVSASASKAQPGVLRTASIDNRLPDAVYTTSGSQLNFVTRARLKLGNSALASLKLDFSNFAFDSPTIGNAISIDECYLERVTGTSESVQVLFSGSAGVTVADGAVNVLSDAILPTSFSAISTFSASMEMWVRVRGHVASAGQYFPLSRRMTQTNTQSLVYNPATVTLSNFTGTGLLTYTGTNVTDYTVMPTYAFCPIMVGVYSSGDPKSAFLLGDSLTEGVFSTTGSGTFIRKALENLGIPSIEFSKGGTSQTTVSEVPHWKPYLAYCRIYIDEMGTNDGNHPLGFYTLWNDVRATYNYDQTVHIGVFPRSSSTDNFATEANQTVIHTYPSFLDTMLNSSQLYGFVDVQHYLTSVRGVNPDKWIVNGTADYSTVDGTHASAAGDDLMATEVQPIIDGLTIS